MSQRISRRRFVHALGGTFALGALSAGALPAHGARDPAPPSSLRSPSVTARQAGPTTNVWAATTTGELPAVVADLPPRVYVPHELGGDIAVIDPGSMQVIDRFWVGRTPHHVTPAHNLYHLYVNVMDSNQLVTIDPWSGRPIGSVPVPVPYNLYFTPDSKKAIVAAERFNRLDFYDATTWQPLARLPIPGSGVDHLDFSADGSYLLVGCEFGGEIVKVDVNQPAVIGVLRAGGLPVDVKLAPAGDVFYVANQGRHGVSIVDPVAMQEVGFLPTGRGAHGMAISRDTRALYVGNRLADTISVIDFEARGVATTWPIGGSPDMLQVSPDGQQLWASGRSHGVVYVVDTNTGELLHRIPTGAAPHGLTYFPQPGRYSIGHNGVYR
jgi:YVTN family beta-propeller protein